MTRARLFDLNRVRPTLGSSDRAMPLRIVRSLTIRKVFCLNAVFLSDFDSSKVRIKLENVAFANVRNQLIVLEFLKFRVTCNPNSLRLYGQANKRTWWMPWR